MWHRYVSCSPCTVAAMDNVKGFKTTPGPVKGECATVVQLYVHWALERCTAMVVPCWNPVPGRQIWGWPGWVHWTRVGSKSDHSESEACVCTACISPPVRIKYYIILNKIFWALAEMERFRFQSALHAHPTSSEEWSPRLSAVALTDASGYTYWWNEYEYSEKLS